MECTIFIVTESVEDSFKALLIIPQTTLETTMLRENLLIFPCVLFGAYLFVNFYI